MKKIVWFDLNSSYAHSSLALPALHAQVRDDGWQWEVVSSTINEHVGMVVESLYVHRPDVVAGTLWLFNHEVMLQVLARLKTLLPSCKVILGGPECLGDNEELLRRNGFVDCVFRGEGEEMFPRWLASYDYPDAWCEITGLCYLDVHGCYCDNGIARVADFACLVAPEESSLFNWEKPFVQLETTRGCFNTCAFCVSGGEKPVRLLPMEEIRRRLSIIHSHGIRDVRVLDRTFNFHPDRASALLQLFAEYAGKMRFHLEIHPALLTPSLRQLLLRAPHGLLHLEAGIQSLRADVLEHSQRKGSIEEAMSGLRFLCRLTNMETHADLIAGLPGYGWEALREDVLELARYKAGEIQLESLKVLPGTEMRRRAAEWGIVYSPYPPYEVLETRAITATELQASRRLSRLLDGFYNAPAWRVVTRQLMLTHADFLDRFLDYLTAKGLIDQPMGLEKRGIVLYDFCRQYYPQDVLSVTLAWIEAGMSLKKTPAEGVRTKHQIPPMEWEEVCFGVFQPSLRWCFVPTDDVMAQHGYWYGFDQENQLVRPVFKGKC